MATLSKLVPDVERMTSVVIPTWMLRGLDDDVAVACFLAWIVFKSKGAELQAEQSEAAISMSTGLSQKQQRRARDILFASGVLHRVHTRGRRMVFKVDVPALLLVQAAGVRAWQKTAIADEEVLP